MAFNKEKVMDAARKFVDKGQIDKAVKEYLRIVHEDPKDVRVWLKIGDLYAKKGSKQDAIETYLKVARFYHEQGFFLKAVAVYKQILKLDPRLVDVILKLAELYRQLGLMSDAMQHFESVAAHFHREGNTKEALATVKKLVDLDPENIATRIKLAELYSKEGLVDDASTEFQVACEQLRRQGRQDDFIKVAERLLWHKPDNHALNRELAGLYLRRNDPRRALQKLQACFKADPRDVETLALLAQAFQALDQKAKTVSVLKELARVHSENKQRDNAAEVFRKILEFVPNDPDALQFLGIAAAPPPQASPAPMAAKAPPPMAPPPRVTPMPAQIRAATGAAQFNLTTDLPALGGASAKMTGSMPLVDEQSLSGVDFALPEYDDADFSADMEPAPDPRMSAAGERHAEEIAKILAETDVYVKYGLHQKAVDHLRRVFALDPDNVEAHDRLKDIFISQGREQEAEVELLKLAELVAPQDPDRAEAYLQDLLAMNGTHTGAFELARRFRLRVARMNSSVSSELEYSVSGGGVAAVDVEMDDLDLAQPPRAAVGVSRSRGRDSIDEFDPDELINDRVAHGSPAPSRPPGPPVRRTPQPAAEDNFELEFEPSPSQSTRQMSPEQVDALNNMHEDTGDPVIVDRGPGHWPGSPVGHQGRLDARNVALAVDAQLDDDDAIGAEISNELHHNHSNGIDGSMTADGEDLPFDPDEARRFDAGVPPKNPSSTDAVYVSGFEETALPSAARRGPQQHAQMADTSSYDDVSEDALSVSGSYDPYGTEAVQTPPFDPTQSNQVLDTSSAQAAEVGHRPETNVEDDLDEADFYASQGMYAEARDILAALAQRYPHHRLIVSKLHEVEAVLAGHGHDMPIEVPADSIEHESPATVDIPASASPFNDHAHEPYDVGGTDALDLDSIEEVSADDFEEVHSEVAANPVPGSKKRRPTVMLEKPVDEGDADTHYDLGLACKEMCLYDEAVKAFEQAARSRAREVQCHLMIGMCYRESGNPSEAIHAFKQGLHAEPSDRERQSLYYEIGMTYEAIGDEAEALYYFEIVTKRDATFADAGMRADHLRARVGRGVRPADDDI